MANIEQLLVKTSRTFALSIPLLPEPTRREVTLAYLLFRILDTLEDAALWPWPARVEAMGDFGRLVDAPTRAEAARLARAWSSRPPVEHPGYVELLEHVPLVLDRFQELDPAAQHLVREHTLRSARGMARFVSRTDGDGVLRLGDLQDLRDYCYVVAGIVGEMLTELFVLNRERVAEIAPTLRPRAAAFGEALQLVNILKDARVDAGEGRLFLPAGVRLDEVFALARRALDTAAEYTLAIQGAGPERGLVAFNALLVRLARASLARVESHGPGAKITRGEVFSIVADVQKAVAEARPAVPPVAAEWSVQPAG